MLQQKGHSEIRNPSTKGTLTSIMQSLGTEGVRLDKSDLHARHYSALKPGRLDALHLVNRGRICFNERDIRNPSMKGTLDSAALIQ